MTALLSRAGAFVDDRINPIVVKELRQAVKSRFIVGVLMLMLALLVVALLLFVMNSDSLGRTSSSEGGSLFAIFQGMLLGVTMLFVPVYLGARLTAERSSATSDLLYVTTLRPGSIVWGKLVAGMAVAGMVFAACAPFMVITYLLRGIDPPTIVFVLALDAMIVLSASTLAIFLGALPTGWPVKILLGAVAAAVGLWVFVAVSVFLIGELTGLGVGGAMGGGDFWWMLLGVGSFWLSCIGLLYFLTVAMIAPPTSNRGLPIRLYLSVCWGVSGVVFLSLSLKLGDGEAMSGWAMSWAFVLLPALLLSTSERDVLGPRLRRAIPRHPLLRVPAFLLFSGAAGGMLWAAGFFVLTLIVAQLGGAWVNGDPLPFGNGSGYDARRGIGLVKLAITGLFVLGYALLGITLRRVFLSRRPRLQVSTAGIVFLIMMLAVIVPMIVVYALYPRSWDLHEALWMFLNPLAPLTHDGDWSQLMDFDFLLLAIALVMAATGLLVNLPWLIRQARAFTPPAGATDHAPTAPEAARG